MSPFQGCNSYVNDIAGIPVFHSRDLVNWKLISHVIDRAKQMDFTGKGVSRSIFAPTIHYHNGLYYVTCTLIDGKGNFVVSATNLAGQGCCILSLAPDSVRCIPVTYVQKSSEMVKQAKFTFNSIFKTR